MSTAWSLGLSVIAGVLVAWLALVGALRQAGQRYGRLRLVDVLRVLPELLMLLKGLATDRSLPRGARAWLGCCWPTWRCRPT